MGKRRSVANECIGRARHVGQGRRRNWALMTLARQPRFSLERPRWRVTGRVRRRKDAEEAEWGLVSSRLLPMEAVFRVNINSVANGNEVGVGGERADSAPRTGAPGDNSPSSPSAIPAPESPSLSVKVPSSPFRPAQLPSPASSFGRNCVQSQAPAIDRAPYERRTWDQLHA